MANNVFGTKYQEPKVISADSATLVVGGAVGYATGVTINFGRTVSPIATLGKGTHYAVGTPGGTITIDTIVTDDKGFADALGMGEKCKLADHVVVTLGSGCGNNNEVTYTLKGVLCSTMTVTARAGTGYVAEGVSGNFVAMEKS